MKEMFLEKGFNGYIPKPIEVSNLDAIIEKWIPLSKRLAINAESDKPEREHFRGKTELQISGFDVIQGINRTGGTEAGYRQVLSSFCRDAEKRLALMEQEIDTPDFTTNVHALKSASATIGAGELSVEAAELENAGKEGNTAIIKDKLPLFLVHLKAAVAEIRDVLDKAKESAETTTVISATGENAGIRPELKELLLQLKDALTAKDMKEIDRLIAQLEDQPVEAKAKDTVSAFSDQVLIGEYKEVIEAIDHLIGV
jgi:HPt (histidine-containing phosphotransfer) domain-containing protein